MKRLEGVDAYPLHWPEGWPRTRRREKSKFACTFAQARDGIIRELGRMGVKHVVVSSWVPLRLDGLPYAGTRERLEDPGVAVYWLDRRGVQQAIACDRWDLVRDNLRAIEKTIEALRGIERWGSTDIVNRAFTGFAALPPAEVIGWRSVLGDCASLYEAERSWKDLAMQHHPDRGGSNEMMTEVNLAFAQAQKEFRDGR